MLDYPTNMIAKVDQGLPFFIAWLYLQQSKLLQLTATGMCEMRPWKQEAMKQIG